MRIGPLAILSFFAAGCADSVVPVPTTPALENVPYELLGSGKIAFERISADHHVVYLIDPVAGTSKVIGSGAFRGPALSPDGTQLALLTLGGQGLVADVFVQLINGSSPRLVAAYPGEEGVPSWTSDGSGITFLREPESGFVRVMTEVRASDGVPRRTVNFNRADVCPLYLGDVEDRVEVSSTGLIATPCSLVDIAILNSDGQLFGRYSMPTGSNYAFIAGFAWSPDGTKLAVMEMRGGAGNVPIAETLHIAAADGSSPREVITIPVSVAANGRYSGANDAPVCWLKGVDRLVMAILNEGRRYSQLWVVNEDGTGLTRITTASQVTDRSVTCAR